MDRDPYTAAVLRLIGRIEETQQGALEQAAQAIFESLKRDGVFHVPSRRRHSPFWPTSPLSDSRGTLCPLLGRGMQFRWARLFPAGIFQD